MRTHCCRHKCFPVCSRAQQMLCVVSETQKMFLILFRNVLCPQQMFPSLRSKETQHSFCVPRVCAPKKHHEQQCVRNNVSSFARAFTALMPAGMQQQRCSTAVCYGLASGWYPSCAQGSSNLPPQFFVRCFWVFLSFSFLLVCSERLHVWCYCFLRHKISSHALLMTLNR